MARQRFLTTFDGYLEPSSMRDDRVLPLAASDATYHAVEVQTEYGHCRPTLLYHCSHMATAAVVQPVPVGAATNGMLPTTSSVMRPARRRQLHRLAHAMLATFNVANPRLRLLRDRGKVLFQVDAAGRRTILRLDPQDRLPLTMLQSELAWLTLLHDQVGLPVPGPLPAPDGRLVVPHADQRGAWYGIRLGTVSSCSRLVVHNWSTLST